MYSVNKEALESILAKKNLAKEQFLVSKMNPQMCRALALRDAQPEGISLSLFCFCMSDCGVCKRRKSRRTRQFGRGDVLF